MKINDEIVNNRSYFTEISAVKVSEISTIKKGRNEQEINNLPSQKRRLKNKAILRVDSINTSSRHMYYRVTCTGHKCSENNLLFSFLRHSLLRLSCATFAWHIFVPALVSKHVADNWTTCTGT